MVIPNSLSYDVNHMHHESHCAVAFYTHDRGIPVRILSLVSVDGVGELQTATIMDHNFNLIKEWHYPEVSRSSVHHSHQILGLRPLEDEYVVMGLSAYHETSPESKGSSPIG